MIGAVKAVVEAGVGFGRSSSNGLDDGWRGGRVWLVPTDKPIAEWKPVAERVL